MERTIRYADTAAATFESGGATNESPTMTKMNMVDALNRAMDEALEADDSVVLLGQDIGKDEGVFRVTANLLEKYGKKRVIDTPLAEAAIAGGAVGMALYGMKPVAEMQFSGFAYQGFHQVEQHVSRFHTRTQGRFKMSMVIRMPYGGGIRAIEHHSESREAYYAHTPGLQMVIPSGPRNARALLLAAIRSDDPVIFFEPKAVYRSFKEDVPDQSETMEIGKSQVVREGSDITMIAYGAMMRPVLESAEELAESDGVGVEVIDMLTVSPIDTDTITNSVAKTGRALIVHEGPRTCGIGAEVVARIVENALMYLEAPIRRVTGYDVQFPYFARERAFLPNADRISRAARETLAF
ncbi:MAG: alpha-ketoacid dehydrogenase subunit beta [Planctomycetota bacterium]